MLPEWKVSEAYQEAGSCIFATITGLKCFPALLFRESQCHKPVDLVIIDFCMADMERWPSELPMSQAG